MTEALTDQRPSSFSIFSKFHDTHHGTIIINFSLLFCLLTLVCWNRNCTARHWLNQGWANYGSGAICGPLGVFIYYHYHLLATVSLFFFFLNTFSTFSLPVSNWHCHLGLLAGPDALIQWSSGTSDAWYFWSFCFCFSYSTASQLNWVKSRHWHTPAWRGMEVRSYIRRTSQ